MKRVLGFLFIAVLLTGCIVVGMPWEVIPNHYSREGLATEGFEWVRVNVTITNKGSSGSITNEVSNFFIVLGDDMYSWNVYDKPTSDIVGMYARGGSRTGDLWFMVEEGSSLEGAELFFQQGNQSIKVPL